MNDEKERQFPHCFRCEDCDWHGASFRATCPVCHSLKIVEASIAHKGEIVDFVSVLFPPDSLKDVGPYVSALVSLDNGCKIFGIISGKPEHLSIGSHVSIRKFDPESRRLYFEVIP
jgi:uncharacterized OB-fold protein